MLCLLEVSNSALQDFIVFAARLYTCGFNQGVQVELQQDQKGASACVHVIARGTREIQLLILFSALPACSNFYTLLMHPCVQGSNVANSLPAAIPLCICPCMPICMGFGAAGVPKVSAGEKLQWPAGVMNGICGDAAGESKWDSPNKWPLAWTYKQGQVINTDIVLALGGPPGQGSTWPMAH